MVTFYGSLNMCTFFDSPGKLDLKFAHGRAKKYVGSNKICPTKVYISKAKITKENNRK